MTRVAYLAALAGGDRAGTRPKLEPPRRLYPPEPILSEGPDAEPSQARVSRTPSEPTDPPGPSSRAPEPPPVPRSTSATPHEFRGAPIVGVRPAPRLDGPLPKPSSVPESPAPAQVTATEVHDDAADAPGTPPTVVASTPGEVPTNPRFGVPSPAARSTLPSLDRSQPLRPVVDGGGAFSVAVSEHTPDTPHDQAAPPRGQAADPRSELEETAPRHALAAAEPPHTTLFTWRPSESRPGSDRQRPTVSPWSAREHRVHIGSIQVTVLPTPSPPKLPVPRMVPTRPPMAVAVSGLGSGRWFGLAQR